MKIYKIYKVKPSVEYDYYNDDFVETTELEEIKYVDSIEKVNEFLSKIQENNKSCDKCVNCQITRQTKRKYNNRKEEIDSYCNEKDLYFEKNFVFCRNDNSCEVDNNIYEYEEIEVE